jgi:O-antigen ligase
VGLTGIVFILLVFAGLSLAFIRHPIYGLYVYVAVFYLDPPSRWWGAHIPDLRWSMLSAVVTLVALLRLKDGDDRPPWYTTTLAKLLIVFTIWLWIQNIWALHHPLHLELSILFTKYVVLYFLIYRLVNTPELIGRFLLVHMAGCAYLGWLAFNIRASGRLEGVGGPGIYEANALAMQLGTAVMVGGMIILTQKGWRRWFCVGTMPFILNAIVLTGSRGAFLALICGGAVLFLLRPDAHKKLFMGFAVLGVVLFGMLAHDMFWERMGTMKSGIEDEQQMDNSALSRFAIVEAQWRMFQRYPQGTGHRGTAVLSPQYIEERFLTVNPDNPDEVPRRSSHNTFMTALTEQGLPGAILWVAMWLWCAFAVKKLRRSSRVEWPPPEAGQFAAIAGSLVVVLVAGIFVDYLKTEVMTWLFALLASQVAIASRRSRAAAPAAMAIEPGKAPAPMRRSPG